MRRPDIGLRTGTAALATPAAPSRRLAAGEVDLWRVSLDQPPAVMAVGSRDVLSPDEQERARRFFFERDRRRFTVGRSVLRHLLAGYLGCDPAEIVFRYGANGKPELGSPATSDLQFNLAHSEGLALYGFTRAGEIGVDLEAIRELPDWEFIAATCFNPEEQQRVAKAPSDRRLAEFFAAWTRQEAVLKATGLGLGGEVRWRRAPSRSGPRHTPWGLKGYTDGYNPAFTTTRAPALRIFPVRIGAGFAATLAIGADVRWINCHTWDAADAAGEGGGARRSRRMRLEQWVQAGGQFL